MADRGLVYISGALTSASDLPKARRLYEKTAEVCEQAGLETFVPHLGNDPELAPDVEPRVVYERDAQALMNASVVVAYIGVASAGVGAELAIAAQRGVKIIAIYSPSARISRFILGLLRSHESIEVLVDSDEEGPEALKSLLAKLDEVCTLSEEGSSYAP